MAWSDRYNNLSPEAKKNIVVANVITQILLAMVLFMFILVAPILYKGGWILSLILVYPTVFYFVYLLRVSIHK